jgi:hypothetical protein
MQLFPYAVYYLDCYSLSHHSLERFKQIASSEDLPDNILDKIENEIIPALEYSLKYLENWEPIDTDVKEYVS